MKDYYQVLGLLPGASAQDIKSAYRRLMKIHHPDVGGDPRRAMEVEEAYRKLSGAVILASKRIPAYPNRRPSSLTRDDSTRAPMVTSGIKGEYLELELLSVEVNQVLQCPRECSFYNRSCRHKRQLSLESRDNLAFRASSVVVRVKNNMGFPQLVDFRNGKGAIIDQLGEFYHCQQACSHQHSPKYKDASVEMFPHTQATVKLWFPQLQPGRYITRFVYKHRVLARTLDGDIFAEEFLEIKSK